LSNRKVGGDKGKDSTEAGRFEKGGIMVNKEGKWQVEKKSVPTRHPSGAVGNGRLARGG